MPRLTMFGSGVPTISGSLPSHTKRDRKCRIALIRARFLS